MGEYDDAGKRWECAGCGHDNPEYASECGACGRCDHCGQVLPTGSTSKETYDMREPHRKTHMSALQTVAHDSGDGMTIYHCPFCGSGQVIARSDRTIECQFCHTCFTVQVQPEFSAFPQTVNGQPMQVPGMPGQVGPDPMAAGGDPTDPDNSSGAPPFGGDEDTDGNGDEDSADEPEDKDDPEAGKDDNQVFASRAYQTANGALLSEDDFIRHMAIRHAADQGLAKQAVKASRQGS